MSADERALREEDLRRFVIEPFLDQFDRDFYAEFGRWPAASPLVGTTPVSARRRAAVQALIDRGATEGEREAARAALARLDAADTADTADEDELAARLERDQADEDEFEDAYMHGAA